MERSNAVSAASRPFPLLAFVVSIAALYFAKEIFIPLALAVLFAFLLTPVVTGLERLRLGRIPSVMLVLIVSFSLIGAIGWVVANQLIEVINQLPNYTSNIREKMGSFRGPHGGSLARATDSVQKLTKELSTSPANQPPKSSPKPTAASIATTRPAPTPVRLTSIFRASSRRSPPPTSSDRRARFWNRI